MKTTIKLNLLEAYKAAKEKNISEEELNLYTLEKEMSACNNYLRSHDVSTVLKLYINEALKIERLYLDCESVKTRFKNVNEIIINSILEAIKWRFRYA